MPEVCLCVPRNTHTHTQKNSKHSIKGQGFHKSAKIAKPLLVGVRRGAGNGQMLAKGCPGGRQGREQRLWQNLTHISVYSSLRDGEKGPQ